ncbi:Urea carboxylase-related aminomethyltransferase [Mycobacterium sp. ACS1612]|uniref:DUF1989 domain-containing protein n=1 Tax=Mycobacterium sp. ACS1612 TaxID=1834117 RepID=UPI0007FF3E8D|nr:urea carboxylase-associated family protein [Mycobacterium sp. ACS1612]OBF32447.1 Urea carboxylase-related aminomethyltransferase [Mycobacterium sp. ACS1612]
METTSSIVVPAGEGRAVALRAGQHVRVVDTEGGQVGDVFAFAADDPFEHLSASHTRTHTSRLFPRIGEAFVTNMRRPILTLIADTSPGTHDMLIAACDPERYRALGAPGHASCADNLRNALTEKGFDIHVVPQPVNVFMTIPIAADGDLGWLPASSRPGDTITFAAAMDCVFVLSACPQDLNAINGGQPTAMEIEILAT